MRYLLVVGLLLFASGIASAGGKPPPKSAASTAATTPTTEVRELRAAVQTQAAELERLWLLESEVELDQAAAALKASALSKPRATRQAVVAEMRRLSKILTSR